jgi:hypothetical protein
MFIVATLALFESDAFEMEAQIQSPTKCDDKRVA